MFLDEEDSKKMHASEPVGVISLTIAQDAI